MWLTKRNKGLTLLEIIITVAIIAVVSGLAYPSFRRTRANMMLHSAARKLYSDLQYAKVKAIETNTSYSVIFDDESNTYIVIEDKNANGSCESPDCGTSGDDILIKRVHIDQEFPGISFSNNISGSFIRFNVRGFSVKNGTITFTNRYGKKAEVRVSLTGRIKLEL